MSQYSTLRYHHRQSKGLCGNCGRPLDQRPYAQCKLCYTPRPRHQPQPPAPFDAALYIATRKREGRHPLEIACCGFWHGVHGAPATMPCCSRVFAEVPDVD